MSHLVLFEQADVVVKIVILSLLIASIWTWAIIVGQGWRLRSGMQASAAYERDLRQAKNIDVLHDRYAISSVPAARLFVAGTSMRLSRFASELSYGDNPLNVFSGTASCSSIGR